VTGQVDGSEGLSRPVRMLAVPARSSGLPAPERGPSGKADKAFPSARSSCSLNRISARHIQLRKMGGPDKTVYAAPAYLPPTAPTSPGPPVRSPQPALLFALSALNQLSPFHFDHG
jgi:hypothetical protein